MDKIYQLKNKKIDISTENNNHVAELISDNLDTEKTILLYGAVQSGKTRNILNILDKVFEKNKSNIVFYVAGNTNELKEQNHKRFKKHFIDKDINVLDTNPKMLTEYINEIITGKTIFVVLKQHLNSVADSIVFYLKNNKILVIDDEADDHSLSEKSLVSYNRIKMAGASIISCTATPFLNLYRNQSFYERYYKLIPGEGYSGIDDFIDNEVLLDDELSDIDLLKFSLLEWASDILDSKVIKDDAQILFNNSTKKDDHDDYAKKLFEICATIAHNYKGFEMVPNYKLRHDIEDIQSVIVKALKNGIKIANSEYKDKPEHKVSNKGYEIIIGGILLSRGITYENLLSEVMINIGDTAQGHTILQRARWCGYRITEEGKSFKNEIKIYLNKEAREAYREVSNIHKLTRDFLLDSERSYTELIDSISEGFSIIKFKR